MQLLFVAVFVYTATLSKGFGKNNVYQDSFPIHGFFNCVFGEFNETRTKQLKEWVQSAVYRVKRLQVVGKMPGERFKRMLRENRLLGNL